MINVVVGSSSGRVKPKTIRLIFVTSSLSTQHYGESAKIGWFGIRINVSEKIGHCSTCSRYDIALSNNHSLPTYVKP